MTFSRGGLVLPKNPLLCADAAQPATIRQAANTSGSEEKLERDRRIGSLRLDITRVRDVANLTRVLRSINRFVNAILSEILKAKPRIASDDDRHVCTSPRPTRARSACR